MGRALEEGVGFSLNMEDRLVDGVIIPNLDDTLVDLEYDGRSPYMEAMLGEGGGGTGGFFSFGSTTASIFVSIVIFAFPLQIVKIGLVPAI